jgi:shikimate kinase
MVSDEGMPPRTVVLIGLMGAGKSCVGRRLAHRFALPFIDADQEIEAAAGCSITEIFERFGEAGFREGERRVMERLLNGPRCILATGGGAFIEPSTRRLVGQKAISVWLKADLDLLVKRTAGRDHRPLLNGGEPRQVLAGLMERRYPIYAEADIIVETLDHPPEMTVQAVCDALTRYFAQPKVCRAASP